MRASGAPCFSIPVSVRTPPSRKVRNRGSFICCSAAAAASDQNGQSHQPAKVQAASSSGSSADVSASKKRRVLRLNVRTAAELSLWHSLELGIQQKRHKFISTASDLLEFAQALGLVLVGVAGGITATTASLALPPGATLPLRTNSSVAAAAATASAHFGPVLLGAGVAGVMFLVLLRQVGKVNVALRDLSLTEARAPNERGEGGAQASKHHHRRPRRIVLVRHGESVGNVDKKVYCSLPDHSLGLTPTGERQARGAGAKLRNVLGARPGRIGFYVSPYTRTTETLRLMLEGARFNPEAQTIRQEVLLREQQFGNFQDPAMTSHFEEERARMGWFWHRMPGGENSADVYARAMLFLDSLFRDLDNTQRPPLDEVVIVSHGLTIRMLLMCMFHWTVDETLKVTGPRNGEMWVLERMPGSDRYELVSELYECERIKTQT